LQDFPGRTETDLYLCISDHRESLRDTLKMEIDTEGAVSDLACNFSHELEQVEPLFADILVPISGAEPSFQGLEQASVIARREEARVYGLHVVAAEEDERSASAKAVRAEFEKRCTEAGVQGYLAVTVGDVPRMICDRAHFTNLVVMKISCPPPPQPLARLSSGVSTVIRRCSRPILVVPRSTTPLDQALLAYDGSAKAREALYIASYLAAQWDIPLAVLSVRERGFSAERAIQEAQGYLEGHGVQAKSVIEDGPVVEAIFKTVQLLETNLIVMGGYGHALLPEMVLGSTVDQVLRTSGIPVLICH
jgi:nucleotide-binding universal stress UspA family protein